MLQTIQTALFLSICLSASISVYYSFKYRRQQEPKLRGTYAAKMNIAMGVMLVAIAMTQLFFFTDSNMRRIFGTVCFLLGLFNLFAGIRNFGFYTRPRS